MMNSGCRTSVCQNERNTCGNTCGTNNDNDRGFQRWKMSLGKTRSRATADTQRDERAQICEEICCDGKSQTERREEKLVAQEHNVEAEAGTGEKHCGVTRNINQHTRTETQWSGEAVTKKDIVCEKIYFTNGAGGKPFKDLGDIDSEATIQTTWSPEGFQLTRTIKKVENFKTNCILDATCDECDSNKSDTCPVTTPSPKCLQSPVCEAVEIKPFKPFCRHPPDFEALASISTFRSPLGFGGGSYALARMNHVRRAHTWTLSASDPRQSQSSGDPQHPVSYAVQSSCTDCLRGPFHPALLSRLLNLSRTCLK